MNAERDRPDAERTEPADGPSDPGGYSIEELSDYLDRGRQPRNPAIEASPAAQHALAALSRLRTVAPRIMAADAQTGQFIPPATTGSSGSSTP